MLPLLKSHVLTCFRIEPKLADRIFAPSTLVNFHYLFCVFYVVVKITVERLYSYDLERIVIVILNMLDGVYKLMYTSTLLESLLRFKPNRSKVNVVAKFG